MTEALAVCSSGLEHICQLSNLLLIVHCILLHPNHNTSCLVMLTVPIFYQPACHSSLSCRDHITSHALQHCFSLSKTLYMHMKTGHVARHAATTVSTPASVWDSVYDLICGNDRDDWNTE